MSEWEDFFTLPEPPKKRKRDPYEGYGRTHGSVREAKEWDDFFTVPEDANLQAPRETSDFSGDMGRGIKEQAGKLLTSTANALSLGPQMVASTISQGPYGLVDPFAQYMESGGQRVAEGEQAPLGTMIERGLTDTSNLNPRAKRDRELGLDPLGDFSPGAAAGVGIAGEIVADPIFGALGGSATLGSVRALEKGAARAAAEAAARKAAQETLETAARRGPAYTLAHGKKIEDAQKLLSYGTQPTKEANGVGKAAMRSVEPGLQLDEVDELVGIRAQRKLAMDDLARGEARTAEDIKLRKVKRKAVADEMGREADEELPGVRGRIAATREGIDKASEARYQAEGKLPKAARENAEVDEMLRRRAADEAALNVPDDLARSSARRVDRAADLEARKTEVALEREASEQEARRVPDVEPARQEAPSLKQALEEQLSGPPAKPIGIQDIKPPEKPLQNMGEVPGMILDEIKAELKRSKLGLEDFTPATQRPPEGVAAPPVAPSGAGKTIDDLFEPTPAPKGEPQQFDLGDFAPSPVASQAARSSLDYVPTRPDEINLVVGGDPANFRNDNALAHLQKAIWDAQKRGAIPVEAHYRKGKITKELGGKGTVQEWLSVKTGEVVGYTRTSRKDADTLVAKFYPHAEGMGRGEAAMPKTIDLGGRALEEERYFKTAGQAATTPAGKPTTGPVKGKAEIAREAAQKAKVHMRTQYPGELPKGKLGEYKRNPQMIVQQFAGDPRTTAHEIGHHLDNVLLTGTKAPRLGQAPEFQQHAAYLDKLGSGDRAEGWADAVEMFVRDPDQLDPAFKAWMIRELRAKNPATLDMLDTLQRGEKGLRNATPGQLIQADIDEANRIAAGEVPVRSNLNPVDKVLTKVVDEQIPAVRMTEDLAPKVKVNGKEVADPDLDLGLKMRAHRAIGNEWHRYMEMGPRPGVPGLRQILENAGDTQKFDQYMAAKADEAMPLGTAWDEARNRTLQNSKALIAEVEGNAAYKDLVQARKDLIAWRKEVLKAARDSGLMDANEFAKQVKDVERGMPMGDVVGGTTTLANEAEAGFKTLIRASENEVGKTMLDLAKRDGAGKWVEILPESARAVKDVEPQGRKVLKVMVDGKETRIAIDQEVAHALEGVDRARRDNFVGKLSEMARIFRRGTTSNIAFAPVMSGKALINSIFTSRVQANPFSALRNFFYGAGHRIAKSDLYRQALKDRALMTGTEALTSKNYQDMLKDINRRDWRMQIKRALSKTIGPKIAGVFEDFARLGEYDALLTNLRRNNPHLSDNALRKLAADSGRNVDADLMTRGASDTARVIAAISPFWNAGLQGWRTEIGAAKELFRNRDATKAAARTATLLGAVGLAWASTKDDKRIRAMDPQERARFLHISLGENNPLLKIPVPPGMYGVLMGTGTLLLDFLEKQDPDAGKEIVDLWGNTAWGLVPITSSPAVQAFSQLVLGKDLRSPFDIRDVENRRLQGVEPGQRSTPSTSEAAKYFGGATNISPIKIDRAANIFFGTAGREAMGLADWFVPGSAKRQKPAYKSIPILRSYLDSGDTQYPRFEKALNDQVRELEMVERTWKSLAGEKKEEYRLEHQDDLRSLKRLEPTMKRLDKLRERAKQIEANRIMEPEEKKRELRKLYLDVINPAAREALVRSGQ